MLTGNVCQPSAPCLVKTVMGIRSHVGLIAAVLLMLPAAGQAAPLPPENSAANQYTEALPGPGGDHPTRDIGSNKGPGNEAGGGKNTADTLGQANATRLERLGPEGRAAAQLAAESPPSPTTREPAEGGGPGGDSGLNQVLGQITGSSDSGGSGLLLPALIAAAAIAAAAFVVLRRRTAQTQDKPISR
jgi:hypothetical protein